MSSPRPTNSTVQRDGASLSIRDGSSSPHLSSEAGTDNNVNSTDQQPRGTSRRVVLDLPSLAHSFEDLQLHRRLPPQQWAPSEAEVLAVENSAQCARALLRKLETLVAHWNTQLIAIMCDKYDERKVGNMIEPVLDPESNEKTALYTNAIADCERDIRSVKRALKHFASIYGRHHEFHDTDLDTDLDSDLDSDLDTDLDMDL
ncbi:hypothetical protein BGZ50_001273 [Haplosporangium sp. Z 11]|nr:hypothetical protein BGZ50_001273 [Haplosporangium sp. Z 11]